MLERIAFWTAVALAAVPAAAADSPHCSARGEASSCPRPAEARPHGVEDPVALTTDGARLGELRGARLPAEALRDVADPTLAATWIEPGALVAVLRLERPWRDARGFPLEVGTYGLRYVVQPPRKEHAGTSPWRDFLVLVPHDSATPAGPVPLDEVMAAASRVTGTRHPAVLPLRRAHGGDETSRDEVRAVFVVETGSGECRSGRRELALILDGRVEPGL